jgi:8-oxo-dGTP diphosphatase
VSAVAASADAEGRPGGRVTRVAAAVIVRPDGCVLLAQRPAGKPYEGYWEFPGGKLEPGEAPAHALARELREELGLDVRRAAPWFVQEHVYPHAHVELNFFRVFAWDGEPQGHDGQAFAWQVPGAFDVAPLLPANTRVLRALALPPVYGISCASDAGEDAFLARAARAFASGLSLVQLREKDWPAPRIDAFAARLCALAHAHGAKVLLNGAADDARRLGLDGVHWTAARLAQAASRPDDLVVGASCHDAQEIARAGALGCDFAVLGPVRATPSHPGAPTLGWEGFARAVEGAHLPVYALGGLAARDLDAAIDHGAHGIAMRRGAWEK